MNQYQAFKGGTSGTDYMPRVARRKKVEIEVRPKFKLIESDYKAMQRLCKNLKMSMSQWMKWQIERSLGNE